MRGFSMTTIETIGIFLLFVFYTMILRRIIQERFPFDGVTVFIISMCISGLAVLGLLGTSSNGLISLILIHHAVLGIALIFIFLCQFIGKFRLSKRERFYDREYKDRIIKTENNKLRKI